MPLILSGDTGISGVDGTAGTPSLQGTDSNTGVFYATDIVGISTGGTERMRIDSSGNVGIGTSSPSGLLHVAYNANTTGWQYLANTNTGSSTRAAYNIFTNSGGGDLRIEVNNSANTADVGASGVKMWNHANAVLSLGTNATERMRITSGGDLAIGDTNNYSARLLVYRQTTADNTVFLWNNNGSASDINTKISLGANTNTSTAYFIYCPQEGVAERFSVRGNGGIYNYQANDSNLSDAREKIDFALAKSYIDVICAIPVQTFKYIDQTDDEKTLGVIAQDVQKVAPELVSESDWGTEDNPKMRLSIYQTDLQYALMKAIQELKAELDIAKAEIKALKGAK